MISTQKHPPETHLRTANEYLLLTNQHRDRTIPEVLELFRRSWPTFAGDGRAVVNSEELSRFYRAAMTDQHLQLMHPAVESFVTLAVAAKDAALQLCGSDSDINFNQILFNVFFPEVSTCQT